MAPYLSIVIPIFNSAKTLRQCLESVFNSQYQDFELIIVDGLSSDASRQICNDFKVIYEPMNHRCDCADKRNRGVQIARAEVILFLDSDIVILSTVLGDIADLMKKRQDIAGLIGSYDDAPGGKKMISQFKFLFHHYIHQQEGEYVDSFWTGCGAIRKGVFNSLGGFNAPFLYDGGVLDVEFGYHLKKDKYRIYNAKQIQVKHLKELTFWEWMYTDITSRGVPWILIMLTYRDLSLRLNTNINAVISILCAWFMVILFGFSFFNGSLIYGVLLLMAVLLMVNRLLLRFFAEKKGIIFSAICLVYLFVYYINCGICVVAGSILYALNRQHR